MICSVQCVRKKKGMKKAFLIYRCSLHEMQFACGSPDHPNHALTSASIRDGIPTMIHSKCARMSQLSHVYPVCIYCKQAHNHNNNNINRNRKVWLIKSTLLISINFFLWNKVIIEMFNKK